MEQEDNRFSEDGVFRFIEGIVTDSIQYHASDLFSVTEEISNDAKKLLKEYNRDAKRVYDDYISNMEALLDGPNPGMLYAMRQIILGESVSLNELSYYMDKDIENILF